MSSHYDSNGSYCCSKEYDRPYTRENMLEMLELHLQNFKDLVEDTVQDIKDIELLISQLKTVPPQYRDGKPLC
jgi:hypothetical protein